MGSLLHYVSNICTSNVHHSIYHANLKMSFDTENEEKPMTDLLLFLSTISNVWLICAIFYEKRHWQSGYLLLLHLSVADLIHDLHAFLYKVITHSFQDMFEDSRESWIKHNTYFGY